MNLNQTISQVETSEREVKEKKFDKYLVFIDKPPKDPEGVVEWVRGVKYKLTDESDDTYYMKQHDQVIGIDKKFEGTLYIIDTIKRPFDR